MSSAQRWGVLGGGGIAPSHIISLQRVPFVTVVGVADIDPAARQRVAANFGVPTYGSSEELVAEAKPDAVTVALPASLHLGAAQLAAERGVDILCEKPLAVSVPDCEEMVRFCKGAGVRLGAILNNRGYAQTRWVKSRIESGQLHAQLVSVRAALAGSGLSLANLVLAVGIHYLDLMRWWLGEPVEVNATCGEGVALAIVRFARAVGEIRLSGVGPTSAGVRVDVEADEGRLTFGRYGIESIDGQIGEPPPWDPEDEGMRFGTGHLAVIREAAEARARGEDFPVTGEEGRAGVAFCEAVLRSAGSRDWEPLS